MLREFPNTDYSLFAIPAKKIFDLNVATFTAATKAQHELVKSLLLQSQERTKAAMAVKNFEGFAWFLKEQSEITQSNIQDLAEGNKAVFNDVQEYMAEVQSILTQIKPEVAKVDDAPKPPQVKKIAVKKIA